MKTHGKTLKPNTKITKVKEVPKPNRRIRK
jgi:hypothetical protein